MKWSILISLLIISTSLSSQETFNRVYDLEENIPGNYFRDMLVVNDDIFTLTTIFCTQDTNYLECAALTKHNLSGELVSMVVEESLATYLSGPNCLASDGDQLILSANELQEVFDSSYLYEYDLDLELGNTTSFQAVDETSIILNEGVLFLDGYKYLYGNIRNISALADSVQIIKLDLANNEIWRRYYSAGNSNLDINNLQSTPDGNLAFMLAIVASPGADTGYNGYQINKIDTSGIVLNTFIFEDYEGAGSSRLLVASDGSFYFSSSSLPGSPDEVTPVGRINKLNSDMTTLEWNFIPPNDPLNDGRFYEFYDYTETQNGDIIVCGMARDDTDSEVEGPDKNTVWNGCVLRFNPAGEVVWLRILKQENDLLPKDEFGRFRPSILNEIIELEDGKLLAAGRVFVNNLQIFNINEFEQEAFHSLMMIMDKNGCIENYPCEEVIRFTSEDKYTYHIGTQWIYETEESFVAPSTGFITREVTDTIMEGDRVKYLGVADTFYVEDRKMYFWDDYYEEYIMYFDFASTTEYDIRYYDEIMDVEGIATIVIDSTGYELISGEFLGVQYVTVINSGTIEGPYQTKVYDGIGEANDGIQFLLGCGLCDPFVNITQLRCFTNDTISYQFVPYPCDTTFVITSVENLLEDKIVLYPNPTASGLVNIDGLDLEVEYQLYALDGKLVQSGWTTNNSLSLPTTGLYFLKLKIANHWIIKKVVR